MQTLALTAINSKAHLLGLLACALFIAHTPRARGEAPAPTDADARSALEAVKRADSNGPMQQGFLLAVLGPE